MTDTEEKCKTIEDIAKHPQFNIIGKCIDNKDSDSIRKIFD